MILGVCDYLEKSLGIPALLARVIFVIWLFNSASAFWVYILIAILISLS